MHLVPMPLFTIFAKWSCKAFGTNSWAFCLPKSGLKTSGGNSKDCENVGHVDGMHVYT